MPLLPKWTASAMMHFLHDSEEEVQKTFSLTDDQMNELREFRKSPEWLNYVQQADERKRRIGRA